jgi:isopentenyl-diphosphate delta-isomerase
MTATTTVTAPPRITAENVATLFPEVDTSLAREVFPSTAEGSAKDSEELAGYDEEQVRLMDEVCIVLDDDDKPIGSASKKACECINSLFIFRLLPKKQSTNQCHG